MTVGTAPSGASRPGTASDTREWKGSHGSPCPQPADHEGRDGGPIGASGRRHHQDHQRPASGVLHPLSPGTTVGSPLVRNRAGGRRRPPRMAQTLSPGPSGRDRCGSGARHRYGCCARPRVGDPFPVELYRTALGKKYVMAITGIIWMGFVFAHMIGNLKMFLGPERVQPLRRVPPRAAGADPAPHGRAVAAAHRADRRLRCCTSTPPTSLTVMNHKARPVKYQSPRDYVAANFASRTMRWTGVHRPAVPRLCTSADLTWGWSTPTSSVATPYHNLVDSLSAVPVAILYIVGQPRPRHPPLPRRRGASSRPSARTTRGSTSGGAGSPPGFAGVDRHRQRLVPHRASSPGSSS